MSYQEKIKEIKADLESKPQLSSEDVLKVVYNIADYFDRELYSLVKALYEHSGKGHLPKLSASQMKKALTKMGLDEDFEVKPSVTIYASHRKGHVLEVG